MEKLLLKTMGSELDSLCRPARSCNCLSPGRSPGDWYFDPASPDVILCTPADGDTAVMAKPLENGDTVVNQASGLVYQYSTDSGITPVGFAQAGETYLVFGEINGNITVPEHCTLIFQGGSFKGELHGNYTTIQAPAVKIFDINLTLDGTFTNECAYPEWWGAMRILDKLPRNNAKNHNELVNELKINCAEAIQKAMDSGFGEIRFSQGLYYVAPIQASNESILTLRYSKRLTLHGSSRKAHNEYDDDMESTVIWTDVDKNVLEICLVNRLNPASALTQPAKFTINGGEINVTKCETFTHAAILIHPTAINGSRLNTTLIGPAKRPHTMTLDQQVSVYGEDKLEPIIWNYADADYVAAANQAFSLELTVDDFVSRLDDLLDNGFMGYGIMICDRGHGETMWGNQRGSMLFTFCNSNISGFGHGICIDYNSQYCVVTSSEFNCTLEHCFRYVYSPSNGFNGGILEGRIQTSSLNRHENYSAPLIYGDFTNAFINPYIWDANYGIDMFKFTNNVENIRFGQRVLTVTNRKNHSYYIQEERVVDTSEDSTIKYSGWHNGARTMAAILQSDCSAFLGGMGIFDQVAIPAHNIKTQSSNYVHLIDDDLLGLDLIDRGIKVTINGFTASDVKKHLGQSSSGFTSLDDKRKHVLLNDLFAHIDVVNWSPFSRDGLKILFKDDFRSYFPPILDDEGNIIAHQASQKYDGGNITVEIDFLSDKSHFLVGASLHLLFLALHLKGQEYSYYKKLKFTLTCLEGVYELYNGPYHDIFADSENGKSKSGDALKDIILPFIFNTNDPDMRPCSMKLEFSGLQQVRHIWSNEFSFGFMIEGRTNRHYSHSIFTSCGGALGGHLSKQGQPYIMGNVEYAKISELPVNAAAGAIAVAGGYPVINTPAGWMLQNLAVTLATLKELNSENGPITAGQEAFVTDCHVRANWTGSQWLFEKLVMSADEILAMQSAIGEFALGQLAYVTDRYSEIRYTGDGWQDLGSGEMIDLLDN